MIYGLCGGRDIDDEERWQGIEQISSHMFNYWSIGRDAVILLAQLVR